MIEYIYVYNIRDNAVLNSLFKKNFEAVDQKNINRDLLKEKYNRDLLKESSKR